MTQDLLVIFPEIVLTLFLMAMLMFGVFRPSKTTDALVARATVVAYIVFAIWLGMMRNGASEAFGGSFVDDQFARYMKALVFISGAAVLLMSERYFKKYNMTAFELPVLMSLAILGMMVMLSASNLLILYIGLEVQSLTLYVIAAFRRDNLRSSEAGLKYFVLGALSSGLFLFGASLTYGFTGAIGFVDIAEATKSGVPSLGLIFGIVLLASAMAFKLSAVPFHMWTPDVYQGAPTPITAFFATATKVAAAGMFARLVIVGFPHILPAWTQIIAFVALLSMFLGSIAGIGQFNIKRLMAYSSIANMGYLLLALAAGTSDGIQAMVIYLTIYVITSLGAFAFIISMERGGQVITDIRDLQNLAKYEPLMALAFAILILSMAGLPPFAGFIGKYLVIAAAADAGLTWLAVAAVIASVIGAYYYLRLVYYMYFGNDVEELDGEISGLGFFILTASSAAVVILMITLFNIDDAALGAAQSLLGS